MSAPTVPSPAATEADALTDLSAGIASSTAASSTAAVGFTSVARILPEADSTGDSGEHRLLLEDILQKMESVGKQSSWTDAARQTLEAQIEAILWRDQASTIATDADSPAHQLWDAVVRMKNDLLRWEFVRALREIRSPEATALEQFIVATLLQSSSAGDRMAAIESVWARDPYRATKRLKKLLNTEKNPTIIGLIKHYIGDESHGQRISSAA